MDLVEKIETYLDKQNLNEQEKVRFALDLLEQCWSNIEDGEDIEDEDENLDDEIDAVVGKKHKEGIKNLMQRPKVKKNEELDED